MHKFDSNKPSTGSMTSLTSFPLFGELPKELQFHVWSFAFFNIPNIYDWVRVDWNSQEEWTKYYMDDKNPKTNFWWYPHRYRFSPEI